MNEPNKELRKIFLKIITLKDCVYKFVWCHQSK